MVTAKEYIFLSILSYCNFTEKEYGKTLFEIFHSDRIEEIVVDSFDILLPKNREILLDYFGHMLKDWKVFYVDNRTATFQDIEASGFYSVVFEKDSKYVIAYRGSEKYPLEDAYKDFIETDLVLGIGRTIPLQFFEGYEVYTSLIEKQNIKREDISITGHSLGGGIAQYVAISSDKFMDYIPEVYTWNAVGINRKGIVNLFEFFDFDKILDNCSGLTMEEKEYFKPFKSSYMDFLARELKRNGAIKDNVTLLDRNKIKIVIDEEFIKRLLKYTNIESCLMKFSLEKRRELLIEGNLFGKLFQFSELGNLLNSAWKLIKKIDRNREYEEKISNYGHSGDLTNSLYRHLGTLYLVDQNFKKSKAQTTSFLYNLKLFRKSVQDLHFEDVFLAFISNKDDNFGMFDKKLNLDFISSYGRKVITREYSVSNDFLAEYYSLVEINNENFLTLKNTLIKGFKRSGLNILYADKIVEQLNKMEQEEFSILWEKMKNKLPSPYKVQDIFDVFIFKK